ncbi:MAG: quaternary ammonium compound efflux SMR transporter SugE [Isosphaeraceae bacterium]|nr:quaternary ammonium compound efflux SMR transporter SugE [Isosphaeraceae bacterium]
MAWVVLIVAGLFETAWAVGLKESRGFTRVGPSIATVVCMAISLYLLGLSLRTLPIGTAYPIWTGIGAVGTVIVGIAWFGESSDLPRIVCILLIVAGIVGLRLFTR